MKDIFGIEADKDDFLPPLSEEAAAEVRRIIARYPHLHPSASSKTEDDDIEEEEEPVDYTRNLNLYERLNARASVAAQKAGYARFKRLPKKRRDAEIAETVEKLGRLLKEKEEFLKALPERIETNSSDESDDEDDDLEDEEEEEDDESSDSEEEAPDGAIDEPGSKAWLNDWWKQMDSAWEEVYSHKISDPRFKRARAYSENSTYEKSEAAKKERRKKRKEKREEKKKRKNVVEEKEVEDEEEEEEEEDEELGIVVEEVVYDEEDDYNGGEKGLEKDDGDVEVLELRTPKAENDKGDGKRSSSAVDIAWQAVFGDTPPSQKLPNFVVVDEKPAATKFENFGSQEKAGILKLTQSIDFAFDSLSHVPVSNKTRKKSVTWDDDFLYSSQEPQKDVETLNIPEVLEPIVAAEKPVKEAENVDLVPAPPTSQSSQPSNLHNHQNAKAMETPNDSGDSAAQSPAPTPPTFSRPPPRLHFQISNASSSDLDITIDDPNNVTMEEEAQNFDDFFNSDDGTAAPRMNRDVTDTVMEEGEMMMNFNVFFNSSEGDFKEKSEAAPEGNAAEEQKATVIDESPPPPSVTQIATESIYKNPKSHQQETMEKTTVIQKPPPITRITTDPVGEEPKDVQEEETTTVIQEDPKKTSPPIVKEIEEEPVEKLVESDDPDSSLPETLPTVSPPSQQSPPRRSGRQKSTAPAKKTPQKRHASPVKVYPKRAKSVRVLDQPQRKMPIRQAKIKKVDPPAAPRAPRKAAQRRAPKTSIIVAPPPTVSRYATRSQAAKHKKK